MEIVVSQESERKCGFRHSSKDGVGIYLMGGALTEPCERLPFPLDVCPTCGSGIRFSRGFTWIQPLRLMSQLVSPRCLKYEYLSAEMREALRVPKDPHNHEACHICHPSEEQQGLLWVGEKFYSPEAFWKEATTMGISKRISAIPHGFEVGKHVVYLGHKKAILAPEPKAGIITAFVPVRVDLVVDTTNVDELPARALSIAKKFGDRARIVKVEPMGQSTINYEEEEESHVDGNGEGPGDRKPGEGSGNEAPGIGEEGL